MAPMKFRISSEYGVLEEIRDGRTHNGIDLAMPRGTELHSIAAGTVERVVDYGDERLGKGLFIRTEDGDVHIYGHLDRIAVTSGERIDTGALIGFSGNSGHSTGPHLHFALMHDGQYADPSPLVGALQHYSGEITGPSFLAIKGPATWFAEKAVDHAQSHVVSGMKAHVLDFLHDAAGIIVDLSYGVGLLTCAVLIILGALGLRDGYRWSGLTFGIYALIRLVLGGITR
ncbi:M23 family metallopeptidase [Paenibacillus xanthanilyticus]|uniref:M23 family metallopeptidase n=1 Tax=Paenibacillus xanthanilyticus TaxID=1783531 RepID=A0ABV8KC67_9BACL